VFGTGDFLMRSVRLLSVSAAGGVTRQLGPARARLLAGALGMGVSALTFARFRVVVRTLR